MRSEIGEKGDKGNTGAVGPLGINGQDGMPGTPGFKGPPGAKETQLVLGTCCNHKLLDNCYNIGLNLCSQF